MAMQCLKKIKFALLKGHSCSWNRHLFVNHAWRKFFHQAFLQGKFILSSKKYCLPPAQSLSRVWRNKCLQFDVKITVKLHTYTVSKFKIGLIGQAIQLTHSKRNLSNEIESEKKKRLENGVASWVRAFLVSLFHHYRANRSGHKHTLFQGDPDQEVGAAERHINVSLPDEPNLYLLWAPLWQIKEFLIMR